MTKGNVPKEEYCIPFGTANIKREGSDITLIAWSGMVGRALEAAEQLAAEEGRVLAPIAFVGEPGETVPVEILPGEGAATASATSLLPRAPPTTPAAAEGRIVAAPAARRFGP